jgi:twitching motility protein PilT
VADYPIGMQQLFEVMLLKCASDLHLKAGCPPGLRVDGRLVPLEGAPPLEPAHVEALAGEIADAAQILALKKSGDLEFSHALAGVSRYRVSLVFQRGSIGAVLRRVPVEIPDIDRLGLPPIVKKLALLPRGLVLVTGPTGSGKSTTLAAMIDFLNREAGGHILTMEDPIEFVHRDQHCFITQREIGTDCGSFGEALRRALRHDPDVIMIGELRDRETISLALTAAETGHLVLATVHTPGAVQTVDRMLDAFPIDERGDARGRLASSLQGVLSQTLLPKIGSGRVAALEVLVVTEGVRSCIRDGKTHQIASQMQTGAAHGMQTQATALAELVRRGVVTEEEAFSVASNPEEMRHQLASGGAYLRSTKGAAASSSPLRRTSPIPGPVDPIAPQEPAPAAAPPPSPAPPRAPAPNTQSILERLRRS